MDTKFIRGTFFLTTSTLISKILGFIYIIPFTALVGNTGYALYKYAYGPYTLMLSISTMGLPLAVSKFVSKYNG
ncbi:oligosaccharide flippase family protein, partial [Priestia megaterium]|uniref:oligosaccharide flippase family protein n=1 Tax=Priestia megaterium TaxID=1404 RepID=UPI002B2514F1